MANAGIFVLSKEELSCCLDSATTSFFRQGKTVVSANGTQQLLILPPLFLTIHSLVYLSISEKEIMRSRCNGFSLIGGANDKF